MRASTSSSIIIRPAQKKDLPQCFRLARAKELKAPNRQSAERWWIHDFLKSRQPFFVATIDRRVVGFTLGECATGQVAPHHLLVVKSEYRRKGIGSKLVGAFEHEVRRRGMTCVLGYAVYRSIGVRRLLKKHQYTAGSLVREYQKFL